MNIFAFSRPSRLLLHYGLFAVICHATAILFLATISDCSTSTALYHRFFPMIEHSLVSIVAVLTGVVGIEYIKRSPRSN